MIKIYLEYDNKVYNPSSGSWSNQIIKTAEALSRLSDPELDELSQIVVKGIRENVKSGTDIFGNPFLPLMPSTKKQKGNSRPLIRTGSMIYNISIEAFTGIREITAIAEYGVYHMTGTKMLVARPWFGFSPYVEGLINQYLTALGYS